MFPYSLAGNLLELDLLIFFFLLQIELESSWLYVFNNFFIKNTKLYVNTYKLVQYLKQKGNIWHF